MSAVCERLKSLAEQAGELPSLVDARRYLEEEPSLIDPVIPGILDMGVSGRSIDFAEKVLNSDTAALGRRRDWRSETGPSRKSRPGKFTGSGRGPSV